MKNISIIQEKCVGCKSCEQSCPIKCISMVENTEGFWYPKVDENKCIQCGKCLKQCPVENLGMHRNTPKSVWAWRNKNDIDIMKSASGGVADSVAKAVLERGGFVYGASYDQQLVVNHIEIKEDREREKIQSSKYVQSDPKDTYSKVKQRLSEGKMVLYTGTPCLIAGLYAYLGGDKDNLYTVDIICHGVPSPKFFKKYIEFQNKRLNDSIIYYNFRSKEKKGWGTQYQYLLKTHKNKEAKILALDPYGRHFLDGDCYRENCYQCPYANTSRVGDLTVGDFWGIAKSHPNFNSPKGVSSVFINTEKGENLFMLINKYGYTKETTLSEALVKQGNLKHPTGRPIIRDLFYNDIDKTNFIDNLKVGLQLKSRIKNILPYNLIQKLKTL